MSLPPFYDYKGYVIIVNSAALRRDGSLAAVVNVIDADKHLAFRATSLVKAMRWVDDQFDSCDREAL